MVRKSIRLGYFSLPENRPKNFPHTFLVLDEDGKIRIGDTSGPEMSYAQFARSLTRGEVVLTDKGKSFVKKIRL